MRQVMTSHLPAWVVLHIPHASTVIPSHCRSQLVLDEAKLQRELLLMSDHFTDELFGPLVAPEQVVRFPVSRLVVDPERFEDDDAEPMSERGMGVVYTRTAHQQTLRRPMDPVERESLLVEFYRPHHQRLEESVGRALSVYKRCLVIDCHSYPAIALPYERHADQKRPEVCIGTDEFHTRAEVTQAFLGAFTEAGFETALNEPFAGALVPTAYYRRDARVQAAMIEIRRSMYMDEQTGAKLEDFQNVASRVRACCVGACAG